MPCRRAIAFVGMPGSGKSTCIEVVSRSLGIPVVSMGDCVREEAVRRGVPLEKLNEFAQRLREELGPEAVAVLTHRKMMELESDVCLVDGVRSLDEVNYFRRMGVEVVIIAIHASPRTRFERLRKRGRADDPRSWSEFEKRDLTELSWGLGNVIALADRVIVNEGSLEEFRRACLEVAKLIAEPLISRSTAHHFSEREPHHLSSPPREGT